MFENIGSKLKGLAVVICWLGIIGTIIYSIVIWSSGVEGAFLPGLLVLVIGLLASWISSCVCYGIGTAAEASESISSLELQINELDEKLNTLQNSIINKAIAHKQKQDQEHVAPNTRLAKEDNNQDDVSDM